MFFTCLAMGGYSSDRQQWKRGDLPQIRNFLEKNDFSNFFLIDKLKAARLTLPSSLSVWLTLAPALIQFSHISAPCCQVQTISGILVIADLWKINICLNNIHPYSSPGLTRPEPHRRPRWTQQTWSWRSSATSGDDSRSARGWRPNVCKKKLIIY